MRTRPIVGDIVKFKTEEFAKHWYHKADEKFVVEEGDADGLSLLGHKEFGNEGSGFAWVSTRHVDIVEYGTDRTLRILDEAMNYEEPEEDDE